MSGGTVVAQRELRWFWKKPRSAWTDVTLFHDARSIHEGTLNDIRSAKRYIDLETYIFEEDSIGSQYVIALTEAERRGVKVRLLLDGIGSLPLQKQTFERLRAAGVQARMFRPFHRWVLLATKWLLLFRFNRFLTEFPWVNKRDHRKLCLIDKKIAWVGSANISERHLEWRETAVRLKGPEMPFIQAGFEMAFAVARKSYSEYTSRMRQLRLRLYRHPLALSSPRVKNKVGFRTWWSGGRYRETLLAGARTRIWIVSPYFIPTAKILRKLLLAAGRGVDVRLMVPETSDWRVTDWVAKTYYRVMLKSGIRIFEYGPAMLHAKLSYVDRIAMLGSSNYNHRSLLHDFELDVVLDSPEAIEALERQWNIDIQKCREFSLERLDSLPLSVKIMGNLLLVFRFFM